MRREMIVVVATVVLLTGCAAFPAKRSPVLPKPRVIPAPAEGTAVRLDVHDHTEKPRAVASALDYARANLPYLLSGRDGAEADYTIELDVGFEQRACCQPLSTLSLFVIPEILTRQVFVAATVRNADHEQLGVFKATGKSKRVIQMHLFWVLPLSAPFIGLVEHKMWNHTFRDALILAGEAIVEDQRLRAAQVRSPTAGDADQTRPDAFRRGRR